MAETRPSCDRFADWLLEDGGDLAAAGWDRHLEECGGCRAQWQSHRMLELALGSEPMPALSPGFAAGLERKLAAGIGTRPLRGWRAAALAAYALAAASLLGWALREAPLPAIDLAAPWVTLAVFVSMPISLLLAIAASRWIPGRAAPPPLRARAL